jgi:hypothetical protein
VYVGVENLVRRGDPHGRWMLTFAFGLIHGFGFASVLRDMGVGARAGGVALPLSHSISASNWGKSPWRPSFCRLSGNCGKENSSCNAAFLPVRLSWPWREHSGLCSAYG